MDDVTDGQAVRRAGVIDDDEPAVDGQIGGDPDELAIGQLDAHPPAERRQLVAVAITQITGRCRQAVIGVEQRSKQTEWRGRRTQPARSVRCPSDVDPDAHDHAAVARSLGKDASELAVVEQHVVGPFEGEGCAGEPATGVDRRQGHATRQLDRLRGHDVKEDRDEQIGPRQRRPRSIAPAATGVLVVGDKDRSVGALASCRQQIIVRAPGRRDVFDGPPGGPFGT